MSPIPYVRGQVVVLTVLRGNRRDLRPAPGGAMVCRRRHAAVPQLRPLCIENSHCFEVK